MSNPLKIHAPERFIAFKTDEPARSKCCIYELKAGTYFCMNPYVRRRGYSPEDAEDLTQGFFERLLERDLLADLRPTGARFRSFLLHALKNHLASEWTRTHAGKRGGTRSMLSLEELNPEARYPQEAVESPDTVFERRWASTVLQQALDRLRKEHVAAGKEALFN